MRVLRRIELAIGGVEVDIIRNVDIRDRLVLWQDGVLD